MRWETSIIFRYNLVIICWGGIDNGLGFFYRVVVVGIAFFWVFWSLGRSILKELGFREVGCMMLVYLG